MEPAIYFYITGGLALILIPLVPQMLSLRISILKGVHLKRLANWHERNRSVHAVTMKNRVAQQAQSDGRSRH